MIENPFIVKGYAGPEYFCDREKETAELLMNILGGYDTVLVSPRRYGKTGLILHTMERLKQSHPEYNALYVDISTTSSLSSLIDLLSSVILNAFPEKTSLGKKFISFLRTMRPYFSVNELSGNPEVHLEFSNATQKENTLGHILSILEKHPKPVLLVLDEFQQITEYPEQNIEALLRSHVQHMHNVRFIFSGSKRRMMASIFNDAARPFYASSATLPIYKLNRDVYGQFIKKHFEENGREIEDDALNLILDWTRCHTYYTQSLCNRIYENGNRLITTRVVLDNCQRILERESYNYMLLREILPAQQWRFLVGVAKEGQVSQITSSSFISKYKIGSTTTAVRAAESLEQKELVLKTVGKDSTSYEVYDVFFSRWLENEF